MEHADINITLYIIHRMFPSALRRGIPCQKIPLPVYPLRRGKPVGLGQVEHGGKGVSGEHGPRNAGKQAGLLYLAAKSLQLRKVCGYLPVVLLHQGLVVEDTVHGIVSGQQVNPSVDGYLIQDSVGKSSDERVAGQVHQAFPGQVFIQNLGSDKNIGDVVRLHLCPGISGGIAAGIGDKIQFYLRIGFGQQVPELLESNVHISGA